MKAIAVTPRAKGSARVIDVAEPRPKTGEALLRILEVGYCGTDVEINEGLYGTAPAGCDYLILGHECIGEVVDIGRRATGLRRGDLVVATVRRPCPHRSCAPCRKGMSDMCVTGDYRERGIGGLHGYMQELVTEVPAFLVKVPKELRAFAVLLEPMSICEKAIVQAEIVQRRLPWKPRRALVLGAGPVGMLGAYIARLRGWDTYVAARASGDFRARLLAKVGARYVSVQQTPLADLARRHGGFDLVIEATGSARVAFQAMELLAKNGVLALTSITAGGRSFEVPAESINLELVLGNRVVFGSVNANRDYFATGVKDMRAIERRWPGALARLVTSRTPYADFADAFTRRASQVKSTIVFGDRAS